MDRLAEIRHRCGLYSHSYLDIGEACRDIQFLLLELTNLDCDKQSVEEQFNHMNHWRISLEADMEQKDRIIQELRGEVRELNRRLHPKCTCWRCMGLEKDPYGEDDTADTLLAGEKTM